MAKMQGVIKKVVYPDRGIIFDRNGKSILENELVVDLMVIPAKVKGTDTMGICSILGIDTATFNKKIGYLAFRNGRQKPSEFERMLSPEIKARFDEIIDKIEPGFYLQERSVRSYPTDAAGNVLGYLGQIDSASLKRPQYAGYQMGDYIGKTGLERYYENILMGQRGIQYWKRDKYNRPTEPLENGRYDSIAVAGKNLYSSLEIKTQQLGEKLMTNKLGAVVAIDPRTGGIISMVSSPGFKPSYLTGVERGKHFAELMNDPRKPLINRAINGTYSPGSTFKTLQAVIGMAEGVMTPETGYGCGGRYRACGGKGVGCHGGGHAGNLKQATAVSCNSYFCHIFRTIVEQPKFNSFEEGLDKWADYMHKMGLGVKTGVDLPNEDTGLIPTSKYYRSKKRTVNSSCNIVSVGIGQGEVDATVLQMANAIAIIANKGFYYQPHLIDSIEGGDKTKILEKYKKKIIAAQLADSSFEAIHDGMEAVVHSSYGTAKREKIPGIIMCGKTGTVENYYRGKKQKNHSFFAAFAPRDTPRIAIACIVENGGYGADVAAPICGLMIEQYLKDTIENKSRRAKINAIEKRNLIPARIFIEYKRQDSIAHAKDTAYLIEKGYIKIINEDSADLVQKAEQDSARADRAKLGNDIIEGKAGNDNENDSKPSADNTDSEAILPNEKNRIKADSAKKN